MIRFVAAVAIALALIPVAGAGMPNPCSLLTNAEVTNAIGGKVASKQIVTSFGGKGSRACQWLGVNLRPTSYAVHHTLMVSTVDITRARFLKLANGSKGAVRVNGIGQIAFHEGNGAITLLEVWQKGVWLTFVAGSVTNPLASEKTAARAALARL